MAINTEQERQSTGHALLPGVFTPPVTTNVAKDILWRMAAAFVPTPNAATTTDVAEFMTALSVTHTPQYVYRRHYETVSYGDMGHTHDDT